jgi:hypothetical protein
MLNLIENNKLKYLILKTFIFLFIAIPQFVYGQLNLSGTITDSLNNKPVPFATVYINGTTNGTLSDSEGKFKINNISVPGEVIVRHISFKTKIFYLNEINFNDLHIVLNKKM